MLNYKSILTAGLLAASSSLSAQAFDILSGQIYVTPKLAYNQTQGDFYLDGNSWISNGISHARARVKESSSESFGHLSAGLAVGYDFGALRTEAEIIYFSAIEQEKKTVDYEENREISALAGFINLYYDIHNVTAFTPYIGGGAGLAKMDGTYTFSGLGFDKENLSGGDDNNFVWHIGGGVTYAFKENMHLDLSYRYINLGDDFGGTNVNIPNLSKAVYTDGSFATHQVGLGLRFNF